MTSVTLRRALSVTGELGVTQCLFILILAVYPIVPATTGLTGSSFFVAQRFLLGFLILVAFADLLTSRERRSRLRTLKWPIIAFAGLLAAGVLSAALSPLPRSAAGGVAFYALQVGAAMLAAFSLTRPFLQNWYLSALCVGALGAALLAACQYLEPTFLAGILGPVITTDQYLLGTTRALARRVSGPFPYPVSLGTYSALTLPFVLCATASRRRVVMILGMLGVVALGIGLVLSQTRLAIIAAVVASLVWLVWSRRRRQFLLLVLAGAALFVGVFGFSAVRSQAQVLWSVVSYQGEKSSTNPGLNSIGQRRTIYRTGWRAFKARPVTGYGMRVPTNHAQTPLFLQYGQPLAFESYAVVVPLEVGALGTFVFLVFMLTLLRRAHALSPRIIRGAIYGAIVAGAVLSIASNLFVVEITYLWIMIGLFLGLGTSSGLRAYRRAGLHTARGV